MIKHIKCNIFDSGADIILHQVNCQGVMGSGIAKQVRTRYPEVYEAYKDLCNRYSEKHKLLGTVQVFCIDSSERKFYIGNLFAQENYGYDGRCYTDYDALRSALSKIKSYAHSNETIAIPYLMGCYRGGGDWKIVHDMIDNIFVGYNVLICEYSGG